MSNKKAEEVEQGMKEYLSKKYNEEFEFVKKPYLYGNEGSVPIYQAKAIPVGRPEYEFFVEGDRLNSGPYIDGYLQAKWTYQGKQEVDKKIREVYGVDTNFFLRYTFEYNDDKFKDLNHSEVLSKCDGKAYINICIDFFCDKFDKSVEAEKAYQILKAYVLDNKIDMYNLTILYFDKGFRQQYDANGNFEGNKTFDQLNEEGVLINYLKVYDFGEHSREVNRSSDVIKYYKY